MPVYEYRCSRGHHYEKTEGFDAPRRQPCPECGTTATRQISLPAVIFKGPGFYSTDNRGSSRGGNGKSSDHSDTSKSTSDGHPHDDGNHSSSRDTGPKIEAASKD
ncbi:MAG TPA: FmdB family zinc ribbon protein [Dehalococcoidia bacterium]|nr:FmdB family zinc ribbon protein [Dehalococcoidia bacterium]